MAENKQDLLTQFSAALSGRAASGRPLVVSIRTRGHSRRSGTLWRKDVVVTSEQALPKADEAEVVLADGGTFAARLAGRDPGTNIAVLRLDGGTEPALPAGGEPRAGALVLALAADRVGGVVSRVGIVHSVGPAWYSRAGGRIDSRIGLDIRLDGGEEGGPVLDAAGGLLGISTEGPGRRVLVIPTATVERVLEPLLATGHVARGWLGATVQSVLVPEAHGGETGQSSGLMIIGVTGQGPAAQAGILMGDILTSVDGTGVGSPSLLAQLLGPESVGHQVQLRLIRAGKVESLAVTVGARPR